MASPLLCGRDWAKVRGFLEAVESQTFLDRLHRKLEQAEPDTALRMELVRLWGCGGNGRESAAPESPEGADTWRTWCKG